MAVDIELARTIGRLKMPVFQALCAFLDAISSDADATFSEAAFPDMLATAVVISRTFTIQPEGALLLVIVTRSLRNVLPNEAESELQMDAARSRSLRLTQRLMRRANLPPMPQETPIASLNWLVGVWLGLVDKHGPALQQSADQRVATFIVLRTLLQRQTANKANEDRFLRPYGSLTSSHPAPIEHVPDDERLSPRESEVLTYMSKGFTIKEMASLMGLKWFTVNDHIKSIHKKLNVSSRAEAAVLASKMGLL